MKITTGHSEALFTKDAVEEVIAVCATVKQPVAALLWMSPEYDVAEAARTIAERWPDLPVAGCTSDGVFSSAGGLTHEGVLFTMISGADLRAEVTVAESLAPGEGIDVATACAGLSPNPALAFAFPAPAWHDVDAAVSEAERLLGCPLVGGCSADHREFTSCHEIAGSRVLTQSMPILAIYGDVEVSVEYGSGWSPIGREYRATRVDGSQLLEVDGLPAERMLSDYYGFEAGESVVEFPLAVQMGPDADPVYRGIFAIDAESGALALGGGIPEGSILRMSEVQLDRILAASREALDRGLVTMEEPAVAFLFNCAGRKWVLGSSAEKELQNLFAGLPDVPVVGMYGFGEIGRIASERVRTSYHNETCVTVLMRSTSSSQAA